MRQVKDVTNRKVAFREKEGGGIFLMLSSLAIVSFSRFVQSQCSLSLFFSFFLVLKELNIYNLDSFHSHNLKQSCFFLNNLLCTPALFKSIIDTVDWVKSSCEGLFYSGDFSRIVSYDILINRLLSWKIKLIFRYWSK